MTNASEAITDINLVAALGTGDGDLTVGSDATVTAVAASTSSATAASTDGNGLNTVATVDNDLVTGINLDTLAAGNNAALSVSATSGQTATASTVGAIGGAALDEATATVAGFDFIYGVDSTAVTVDNNSSKLTVAAGLTGAATASNVNGAASTATAGDQSYVIGINSGSVEVGNSLTGTAGLRVDATSNLTATANGVDGIATASAGADSGGSTAAVTGIDTSDLAINNSGNITSVAASTVSATASTTADDANAYAGQTGTAIFDTPIAIGNDGNTIGQTTLVGNAAATTVGSSTTAADAVANLDLGAIGIRQKTTGADITVGDTGNVTGNAFASGGAVAQTTSGTATADADVSTDGIFLNSSTAPGSIAPDITISGSGSVSGLGVIGTLSSTGSLANSVQVTAAAVSDAATATGVFGGSGITGRNGTESTITAGPRDGDITGQMFAGASVTASTTGTGFGNDAKATIDPSSIFGIQNVDLIGAQVGSNLVKGTSFGTFNATATSVAGDATGESINCGNGIFVGAYEDTLNVNGSVLAQAQLSNTVLATTVAGNADATATNNAFGLSNYDVTIINGGNLTANAISNASSTGTSVGGNV